MSPAARPSTVAELVELAPSQAWGVNRLYLAGDGTAQAELGGLVFASSYEGIFDASVGGQTQSLQAAPGEYARFGDEIGYQGQLLSLATASTDSDLLSPIEDAALLVATDRLARMLHTINFFGTQRHGLLFLNVHARLLKSIKYDHGRYFSEALLALGLNPGRIVIELPETAVAHHAFVDYLIKSYQSFGFKVAGNLHNAGQIMSIPHISRLDFIKIHADTALRDGMVRPLLQYAARLRTPLIFKHVDTIGQFTMLQQFEARFVQGQLFSEPARAG